ncbi:MAG: hypothetical protein ACKVJA_06370, partial [Flavobacteriales bacterium]
PMIGFGQSKKKQIIRLNQIVDSLIDETNNLNKKIFEENKRNNVLLGEVNESKSLNLELKKKNYSLNNTEKDLKNIINNLKKSIDSLELKNIEINNLIISIEDSIRSNMYTVSPDLLYVPAKFISESYLGEEDYIFNFYLMAEGDFFDEKSFITSSGSYENFLLGNPEKVKSGKVYIIGISYAVNEAEYLIDYLESIRVLNKQEFDLYLK